MESHKLLNKNGVEFNMSSEDLVSADNREILIADGIRIRNIQEGCR